ncbi:MAG: protease modulator HflC [Spirochaetaceae bacterium]|nr:MAG: protease modulator HflC [Spirochaetaceae bacterium]
MNNKQITVIVAIGILIAGFLALGPLYIVEEGEQVVVTRFGQIVTVKTDAGLKLKWPIIDKVHQYPQKILSWDGEQQRIPTAENQFIWVDTTARWKISDPERFYQRITTLTGAYGRLDDIIDSSVRAVIAENSIAEAVRSSNLINETKDEAAFIGDTGAVEGELGEEDSFRELMTMIAFDVQHDSIEKGRRQLSDLMMANAKDDVAEFGIELIDVVIRQIRYSDDLTEAVFNRMISERNQIAEAYRSYGDGRGRELLGQLERERETILSKAEAESQQIRAQADGEAARIYNEAYSQNIEFFEFWRALESYQRTLPNMDKTLSTDMEYFRYLYDSQGNR